MRSVGRYLRVAVAGAIAGAVLAIGCVLVALTLVGDVRRPDPYLAFAVAFGGVLLVVSVTVAIVERRWRARKASDALRETYQLVRDAITTEALSVAGRINIIGMTMVFVLLAGDGTLDVVTAIVEIGVRATRRATRR